MTAHVRKGFEKWSDRQYGAASLRMALQETAFRAGVRFEQGREQARGNTLGNHVTKQELQIEALKLNLSRALELLSRTPAGKREADKLREVLK